MEFLFGLTNNNPLVTNPLANNGTYGQAQNHPSPAGVFLLYNGNNFGLYNGNALELLE